MPSMQRLRRCCGRRRGAGWVLPGKRHSVMLRRTVQSNRDPESFRQKGLAMHRTITVAPLLFVLALGTLVLGLTPAAATQDSASKILRINAGDFFPDPTFDPQLSDNGQGFYLFDFEGLTRIDEELQVVPGAAESWEFSPDGKTLTFHLREELVFSDGVPITAEHFRFGIERMCSPELNSRIAIQLFDIVGCEELFTGGDEASAAQDNASPAPTARPVTLGVHALDERTLEIQFER